MITKPAAWIAAFALLFCSGCFSSVATVSFYTLNPAVAQNIPPPASASAPLIIGIGPLSLPDYLDREAIVTRISPNRLEVSNRHRWAGTLKSEILRVVAANLEILTGVREVVVFPWNTQIEPDLRFRLDIQAFEGRRGGTVQLKAAWSLWPSRSDQPAVSRVTHVEEIIQGDDYDALAAAMGKALAGLSVQMADAVLKASARQ